MSLTRIVCPECGAGLKSSSGFSVGNNVCCPKCETYFEVEDPAEAEVEAEATPRKKRMPVVKDDEGDDDEPQRKKKKKKKNASQSYKNSPLRYVILGVLVTAMLVLGVMLILKKKPDSKEQVRADDSSPATDTQKPAPPIPPNGGSGDQPSPKGPKRDWKPAEGPPDDPAMNDPAAKKFREVLIGKWRFNYQNSENKTKTGTMEYKANGLYIAVLNDNEPNNTVSMTGTWKGVKALINPNDGMAIGLVVEITLQKTYTRQLEITFNPPDEILQQYFGPSAGVQLFLLKYARVKE